MPICPRQWVATQPGYGAWPSPATTRSRSHLRRVAPRAPHRLPSQIASTMRARAQTSLTATTVPSAAQAATHPWVLSSVAPALGSSARAGAACSYTHRLRRHPHSHAIHRRRRRRPPLHHPPLSPRPHPHARRRYRRRPRAAPRAAASSTYVSNRVDPSHAARCCASTQARWVRCARRAVYLPLRCLPRCLRLRPRRRHCPPHRLHAVSVRSLSCSSLTVPHQWPRPHRACAPSRRSLRPKSTSQCTGLRWRS